MAFDETSPTVRSIVVPVDGTSDSTRAVPLAARLAADLGCEIVIISVVANFRTEAPTRVESLRGQLAAVPDSVERRIIQARSVTRTIAEESVDALVCLATTAEPFDQEGFRHTVTDELIAAATSPVVVLGPDCRADPEISRIVVAVDPAHDQEGLAYWATRLGYQLSLPVDFVHVAVDDAPDLGPKIRTVEPGDGESVVDRLLAEADGALLAMGSHGRTGFRRLIQGSIGAAVIPRATGPVLILGPNVEREPGRR